MNREEKAIFIKDFAENYKMSDATFVVGVGGLTVVQTQSLRSKLRECGAKLQIGKVRLMKIALRSVNSDEAFIESLGNQVGAIFVSKDVQQAAKNLIGFSKKIEITKVISGVFKNKFMSSAGISRLASIPPYPVLIAQLAGTLNAPIASLARALKAVADKGLAAQN